MITIYFFIISFLLNFVWEMWQMPFFIFDAQDSYLRMNIMCTQASIGDGMITIIAYLITSKVFDNSKWYHEWKTKYIIIYLCVGVLLTVVLELYNTMILGRWSYAGIMPLLPIIKIGLVPILQWLIVPILVVYTINFGERLGQTNEN